MLREHGSRNKIIKAAPRPNPESEPELEPIKSDPGNLTVQQLVPQFAPNRSEITAGHCIYVSLGR